MLENVGKFSEIILHSIARFELLNLGIMLPHVTEFQVLKRDRKSSKLLIYMVEPRKWHYFGRLFKNPLNSRQTHTPPVYKQIKRMKTGVKFGNIWTRFGNILVFRPRKVEYLKSKK